MKTKTKTTWIIAAAATLSLVAADMALAASKHRARHARHGHYAPSVVLRGPVAQEPARMIELRPGYFISSYDCYTDEGYGRFRPCSAGGRGL